MSTFSTARCKITDLGDLIEVGIWIVYDWPIHCTVTHNYRNVLINVVVDQQPPRCIGYGFDCSNILTSL